MRFTLPRLCVVVAGLTTQWAACDRASQTDPEARVLKPGFIAVVGRHVDDPLWPILKAGALAYAGRMSPYEVRLLAPPEAGGSQDDILRSLLGEPVRAVCIHAPERMPPAGLAAELQTRGVPVTTTIQYIAPEVQHPRAAVDDAEVGRKLAEATAAAVGQGSIMVLHAGKRHPVYGPRLAAFEAELARFPSVEVFASIDCHMDVAEARAIIAERAERFPRLTAWVLLDDWPVRAAEPISSLLPRDCRIITFGCSPRVWPLIDSGVCVAAVEGLYGELGARCVMLCELALSDSQMDSHYRIPTRVVTRENLPEHVREWRRWAADAAPATSAAASQGE